MTKPLRADLLAKAGYAARGAIYVLLAWFAWNTRGIVDEGQEGVLARVQDMVFGAIMLWVLFAGLLAYGAYKLANALIDLDRKGHSLKGAGVRASIAIGALAYLGLAWSALQFAMGLRRSADHSSSSAGYAHDSLSIPLGWLVVVAVGAAFIGVAVFQARQAITRGFMKRMDPDAPPLTCTMGRIGYAARAVVFALVGYGIANAGLTGDHKEARDLGGVLANLQTNPAIYLPVAIGLGVFGLYSLLQARYRIVPRVDVVAAAKDKAAAKLV